MVGGLNREIRLQIFERRGSRRQAEVTKSVSALRVRERARARPPLPRIPSVRCSSVGSAAIDGKRLVQALGQCGGAKTGRFAGSGRQRESEIKRGWGMRLNNILHCTIDPTPTLPGGVVAAQPSARVSH